ncbi:MAG: hypothetical protein ABR574_07105, partial [Cryomorphaceae bacterium]
ITPLIFFLRSAVFAMRGFNFSNWAHVGKTRSAAFAMQWNNIPLRSQRKAGGFYNARQHEILEQSLINIIFLA